MLTDLIRMLYDGQGDLSSEKSLVELLELHWSDIESEGIVPQVYHLLASDGRLSAVQPFYRQRLELEGRTTLVQNLLIRREIRRIYTELDTLQISAIPIKGVDLAERFFGHLGARSTSDIDLLVRSSDLEKVISCLQSLGFGGLFECSPFHFHYTMAKVIPMQSDALAIDLHWSIVAGDGTAKLDVDPLWQESLALTEHGNIRGLSTQHMFYILCLHGANHRMEGLKYSLDLVHFICRHTDQIDYVNLMQQAERDRTGQRVRTVLSYVYKQFPYLHSVKLLPFAVMTQQEESILHSPTKLVDTWPYRLKLRMGRIFPGPKRISWYTSTPKDKVTWSTYFRFYSARMRKTVRTVVRLLLSE